MAKTEKNGELNTTHPPTHSHTDCVLRQHDLCLRRHKPTHLDYARTSFTAALPGLPARTRLINPPRHPATGSPSLREMDGSGFLRPKFGPARLGCGPNGSTSCRAHAPPFPRTRGSSRRFCFCPSHLPRLRKCLQKFAPMRGREAAFGGRGCLRCTSSDLAGNVTGQFFDLPLQNFNLLSERDCPPQLRCRIVGKRFHFAENAYKFP